MTRDVGQDVEKRGRRRLNDILVDGLWDLLKKETGKTRKDVEALLPAVQKPPRSKVTPITKSQSIKE